MAYNAAKRQESRDLAALKLEHLYRKGDNGSLNAIAVHPEATSELLHCVIMKKLGHVGSSKRMSIFRCYYPKQEEQQGLHPSLKYLSYGEEIALLPHDVADRDSVILLNAMMHRNLNRVHLDLVVDRLVYLYRYTPLPPKHARREPTLGIDGERENFQRFVIELLKEVAGKERILPKTLEKMWWLDSAELNAVLLKRKELPGDLRAMYEPLYHAVRVSDHGLEPGSLSPAEALLGERRDDAHAQP